MKEMRNGYLQIVCKCVNIVYILCVTSSMYRFANTYISKPYLAREKEMISIFSLQSILDLS